MQATADIDTVQKKPCSAPKESLTAFLGFAEAENGRTKRPAFFFFLRMRRAILQIIIVSGFIFL